MNKISKQLSIYSLSSLAIIGASAAYADQDVFVPTLDGGLTASIGTFYATPSTSNNSTFLVVDDTSTDVETVQLENVGGDYDWGFEASLGYIFEDTANGIELSYRGINTTNSTSDTFIGDGGAIPVGGELKYKDSLGFELNNVDLMFSQYIDVGQQMQLRLSAGASYVDLEQTQTLETFDNLVSVNPIPEPKQDLTQSAKYTEQSSYTGWGPRLGMDARYDFGQGFGIVGGASVAYFLGDNDVNASSYTIAAEATKELALQETFSEDFDNQAVTNLRGNVGIDYVYFFDNEERSTIGLELGYLVDYYANAGVGFDAAVSQNIGNAKKPVTSKIPVPTSDDITFSGPYLNLKGAF